MKKLVAYFSAEGPTKKVAERLSEALDADIFEIKPQVPYTAADIRWTNPLARCNKEKMGKKDVPVSGRVENMADYELVFLGFPIWYNGAPNVVETFVKGYDFSGKRVAVFATSGGSGAAHSTKKLSALLGPNAKIIDAKLFSSGASGEELKKWADGL